MEVPQRVVVNSPQGFKEFSMNRHGDPLGLELRESLPSQCGGQKYIRILATQLAMMLTGGWGEP